RGGVGRVRERPATFDRRLDDRLGRCLVEMPGPFGLAAVAHHAQADPGDLHPGRTQLYVVHLMSFRCFSRSIATPSTTRVMPATSRTVGIWRSTMAPMMAPMMAAAPAARPGVGLGVVRADHAWSGQGVSGAVALPRSPVLRY